MLAWCVARQLGREGCNVVKGALFSASSAIARARTPLHSSAGEFRREGSEVRANGRVGDRSGERREERGSIEPIDHPTFPPPTHRGILPWKLSIAPFLLANAAFLSTGRKEVGQ